jgi:hypothetical protein
MSSRIIYTKKMRELRREAKFRKRMERRKLKRAAVHLTDVGKQMA